VGHKRYTPATAIFIEKADKGKKNKRSRKQFFLAAAHMLKILTYKAF